jgi:predicted enzyme related to lactoylglutathione lyase
MRNQNNNIGILVYMDSTSSLSPGRIVGIGGIFFKSPDAKTLRTWYHEKLGIEAGASGKMFAWKSVEVPEREQLTIWSIFPSTSNYFGPSNPAFMINYIVDDLDAFLLKVSEAGGVNIDPKRDDHEYGRFAWIYDPDGNKIELWEPPSSTS